MMGTCLVTRWLLTLSVLLVLIGALAAWTLAEDDDAGATAIVTSGRLDPVIETSGSLAPADTAVARGDVSGKLAVVAVQPGDRVAAGDIVGQLAREPFEQAVEAATRSLEAAELAETLAVARAESGGLQDQANVLLAAGEVATARAALERTERDLGASIILAPVDGTVLEVAAGDGDPYKAGAPLATINAGDRLQAVVGLDEIDVPHVPPGTSVRLIVDAFPDRELGGTVTNVAPVGSAQGGGVVFPARVAIEDFGGIAARPGMTVAVTVRPERAEDVVLVPGEAITSVGERSFVTVVRDGEEVTVEVVTGRRANGLVEIAAGDLVPGERVRLRE